MKTPVEFIEEHTMGEKGDPPGERSLILTNDDVADRDAEVAVHWLERAVEACDCNRGDLDHYCCVPLLDEIIESIHELIAEAGGEKWANRKSTSD